MKKIAIFTIIDFNNYGNRFQNYALQEVLQEMGYDVTTIMKAEGFYAKEAHNKQINRLRKINLKKIMRYFQAIQNRQIYHNRQEKLKKFSLEKIKFSSIIITQNFFPNSIVSKYDYFITGSDQVWNPILGSGTSVDFLRFAPQKKRIAYAPSFGTTQIPSAFEDKYAHWIKEIEHISVREKSGAEIIRNLTGIEAAVLSDPTLIVDVEKWESMAKSVQWPNFRGHITSYLIGDISKKYKKSIKDIAARNELQLVCLNEPHEKDLFSVSPEEFLSCFYYSSLIITNSFHGVVFSILFKKPFVVIEREGMQSRTDSILEMFGYSDRKWDNIDNISLFKINTQGISYVLEAEKQKAIKFLRDALT